MQPDDLNENSPLRDLIHVASKQGIDPTRKEPVKVRVQLGPDFVAVLQIRVVTINDKPVLQADDAVYGRIGTVPPAAEQVIRELRGEVKRLEAMLESMGARKH